MNRMGTARAMARQRLWSATTAWLLLMIAATPVGAQVANPFATLVPIGTAYAGSDINAVSFRQKSLTSVEVGGGQTYQYAAYYRDVAGPTPNRRVTVARCLLGSSTWELFNQSFGDSNSNGADSHNTISIGIDGDGFMHLSYGMHNNNLVYRKSTASVLNSNPIAFGGTQPMIGAGGAANDENSVTYPQFYNLPDGDLLFLYRNGGSGDGNTYLNRYNTATDTWAAVHHPLFDGLASSVNAYPNTFAFDSQGDLHFTWTDRSTPSFQTNHNIYYARSPDEGVAWTKMNGTPYALPITESTAEVAVPIPQNSTLINQTSMTIDQNDRPVVASWWAPGAPDNNTRQYMLAYFDGAAWQTSQITNRPTEPLQGDSTVRELARPIVMVDDDNRTLVVMRYKEESNVVTVAYSQNKQDWDFVDLTSGSLGTWEPTYDAELWQRENKLHLLYQPLGLGATTSTISVLEWDARAFFLSLAGEPMTLQINRTTGLATIVNPNGTAVAISEYGIASAGGQLSPTLWSSLTDQAVAGWMETQALSTALGETNSSGSLSLGGSGSQSLGMAYENQPIAFGIDAAGDLTFQYTVAGTPRSGTVVYTGPSLNNLVLTVDPTTGLARLENMSPFPVTIDAYTLTSDSNSLDPAGLRGLDFQNADNGLWEEANLDEGRLSEVQRNGETTLEGGASYNLGKIYDTSSDDEDVEFQFLIFDASIADDGVVRFLPLGVPGDYNNDGTVNAADYTIYRNNSGTSAVLSNDTTPGVVTIADFNLWKANYGIVFDGSGGSGINANLAAVPEPATSLLAALISVASMCVCRQRNSGLKGHDAIAQAAGLGIVTRACGSPTA